MPSLTWAAGSSLVPGVPERWWEPESSSSVAVQAELAA